MFAAVVKLYLDFSAFLVELSFAELSDFFSSFFVSLESLPLAS
jgi:hypothetical protein